MAASPAVGDGMELDCCSPLWVRSCCGAGGGPGAAFGPTGTKAAARCLGLCRVGCCSLRVRWQRERFLPPRSAGGSSGRNRSFLLLWICSTLIPHKWGHTSPGPFCTLQSGFASFTLLASGAGSSGARGDAPWAGSCRGSGWSPQPSLVLRPTRRGRDLPGCSLLGMGPALPCWAGSPKPLLLLPASHASCSVPVRALRASIG